MKKKSALKPHIVLFVEGDTDKVFFDALIAYYRKMSQSQLTSNQVVNLKGVSRYTSKVLGKLENDICPKASSNGREVKAVFCSYDTDVFEPKGQTLVNWSKVKRGVQALGIKSFYRIEVRHEMEDWFLDDLPGLCSYLHLSAMPSISGGTGYEKILSLFKKANKVYLKGLSVSKFIGSIDMAKIRAMHAKELKMLEEMLNVNISQIKNDK